MRSIIVFMIVAVAVMVAPRHAHAQSSVAASQFREAKKMYDDEQYPDALQLFQLAWEHSHSPNARLYIARCFLKLGKYKPAYDEFRGTLRDATDKLAEDPKYEGTQSAAAAELVLLEPKIAHLVVSIDAADAKDIAVTVNGEPFPSVSWGSLVTVDPGSYKVVASAPGKADVTKEVTIAGGSTEAIALYFIPEARGPAPATVPEPTQEAAVGLSSLQLVGLITGAVGLGGLLAAAGTGIAAGSKFSALESACGGTTCPDASFAEIVDSGKTLEVVTYILLGAGGGLAITGGALWLFGGDSEPQEPAATAILTPLPGGAFVGAAGRF